MDSHVIVENFLPEVDAYREECLKHPFYDVWSGAEIFPRIQVHDAREFQSLMEAAVGREIDRAFNWIISTPKGATVPRIHTDDDLGDVEAVLYLNRPGDCQGGMALWRHKETGLTRRPTRHDISRLGKSPRRVLAGLWEDGKHPDRWELVAMPEMKTNRLVFYPADCFHSRYPFEGFGTTPADSRMIRASFFRYRTTEQPNEEHTLFNGVADGR